MPWPKWDDSSKQCALQLRGWTQVENQKAYTNSSLMSVCTQFLNSISSQRMCSHVPLRQCILPGLHLCRELVRMSLIPLLCLLVNICIFKWDFWKGRRVKLHHKAGQRNMVPKKSHSMTLLCWVAVMSYSWELLSAGRNLTWKLKSLFTIVTTLMESRLQLFIWEQLLLPARTLPPFYSD